MGRNLMILGVIIFLVGIGWQWGSRFGLGSLPGDFTFKRGAFTFYAPIATSIVLSLILSFILWLFRR